jgi:hypothetical protein
MSCSDRNSVDPISAHGRRSPARAACNKKLALTK